MSEAKPLYNANYDVDTSHLNESIESFREIACSQEIKGIEKYGKPLDPLDDYDWLDMASEELVDGFKYLEAEYKKRSYCVNKIRNLLKYKPNSVTRVEIEFWLDKLEGKQ